MITFVIGNIRVCVVLFDKRHKRVLTLVAFVPLIRNFLVFIRIDKHLMDINDLVISRILFDKIDDECRARRR